MYKNKKINIPETPQKRDRLKKLFFCLHALPPAHSSLEAYAQIFNTFNLMEDQLWGASHWDFPRTFAHGAVTERMYGSHADCNEYVLEYPGVMNMVHTHHFVFISASGAIEIQRETNEDEEKIPYYTRRHAIMFEKPDAYGRTVWDEANRDRNFNPKIQQAIIKDSYPLVELHGWSPLAELPNEVKSAIYERFISDICIADNVENPSVSTQKVRDAFKVAAIGNTQEVFDYCIKKIEIDDHYWPVFMDVAFSAFDADQKSSAKTAEQQTQLREDKQQYLTQNIRHFVYKS